jgi:hypothetical protein
MAKSFVLSDTGVVWRLGGQLDFSHLLTEPKIPPRLPRLTVRKGIKDGWIVGHLKYLILNLYHENN